MIDWRKQYFDAKRDRAIAELELVNCSPEEDLAIQSGRDDADINILVRRFGVTGRLERPANPPVFGDFSDVVDFQDALHLVHDAQAEFLQMPAKLRARFSNSPGELMAFLADPENHEESVRLGLRNPPPPPAAVVPAVDSVES